MIVTIKQSSQLAFGEWPIRFLDILRNTITSALADHCSCVLTVPLYLLFLWSHCSSVSVFPCFCVLTLPLYLCSYCSFESPVALYALLICTQCSLFLCTHCHSVPVRLLPVNVFSEPGIWETILNVKYFKILRQRSLLKTHVETYETSSQWRKFLF